MSTAGIITTSSSPAIPFCINCLGMHPDEGLSVMKQMFRMKNPTEYLGTQVAAMRHKKHVYADKVCSFCGRYYDKNADVDETFKKTAQFVKASFDDEGVFGLSDTQINRVVATCRKSVQTLLQHRIEYVAHAQGVMKKTGSIEKANELIERMTFAGKLAVIITVAIDARKSRMDGDFSFLDKSGVIR